MARTIKNRVLGETWRGKRVVIKEGWEGTGRHGIALTNPVFASQFWLGVKWDDEEDPDFFKLSGLLEDMDRRTGVERRDPLFGRVSARRLGRLALEKPGDFLLLSCGHGRFDTQGDCLTCLRFCVDVLNRRLSEAIAKSTAPPQQATSYPPGPAGFGTEKPR